MEASLGLDVVEQVGQLFVVETTFQARNQALGFFGSFRAEIGQSGQLELVDLGLGEQRSDGRDVLHVLELGEPLAVVERLHEHFGKFLLLFFRLILEKKLNRIERKLSRMGLSLSPQMIDI